MVKRRSKCPLVRMTLVFILETTRTPLEGGQGTIGVVGGSVYGDKLQVFKHGVVGKLHISGADGHSDHPWHVVTPHWIQQVET